MTEEVAKEAGQDLAPDQDPEIENHLILQEREESKKKIFNPPPYASHLVKNATACPHT